MIRVRLGGDLGEGLVVQTGDATEPDGLEVPQSLQGLHQDSPVLQHDPAQGQGGQGHGEGPQRLVVGVLTQVNAVR